MSFKLLDDQIPEDQIPSESNGEAEKPEDKKGFGKKLLEDAKFTAKNLPRNIASAAVAAGSVALGLPGDILAFFNDLVAAPIASAISGKPKVPYRETPLGKGFGTSRDIEEDIHRVVPFTKPKNKWERGSNEIISTATSFLLPGAQAREGRFLRTSPVTRAFFKSIGSKIFGEGIANLTGDEKKGDIAKAGSLFAMSILDRQGVGRFVGAVYNRAREALTAARNPRVNATRYVNNLTEMRSRLTTGTMAPSEAAVVQDIDRALAHVQNGQMPVENLWGVSRSLNERRMEAMRAAPSRGDRIRARRFYDSLIRTTNIELADYGRVNPNFGIPFQEAQEGFGTLARSNMMGNWVRDNITYNPVTSGLLHLFGGGLGAAVVKSGMGSVQGTAAPALVYQSAKLLYRIQQSPLLRQYYFTALMGAGRENLQMFNRSVQKMDKAMQKEDEKEKPYRLLD